MSIYQANVNGALLTADEFKNKYGASYRQQGIKPSCPLCQSDIIFAAANSMANIKPHFRHDEHIDCPWSAHSRLSHINPTKVSEEHGIKLKSEFCKLNNLKQVFKTTQNIHGEYMNGELFYELCKKANQYQVWNYVGLTLEYLPYILLTLYTFSGIKKNEKGLFYYHYTINKPSSKPIDVIWQTPNKYKLQKRFTKTGIIMRNSKDITIICHSLTAPDNPYVKDVDFEYIVRCCQKMLNPK